jgi:MFS family permease
MVRSRFFYGYVIVAVCFLINLAVAGMLGSFGILFRPIIEDMGWTRTEASGAFSLFSIVGGVLGIIGGMLNDKLGPRVVLLFFGLASAAGYFLVSQMHSLWQFYFFYGFIAGLGSNVFVPTMSTVARWFLKKRSLMSGIAFSGSGLGMVILPLFLNWIVGTYDWRWSLIIMSILICFVTVLAVILLKADPGKIGQLPFGATKTESGKTYSETGSITFRNAIRTGVFWVLLCSLFCFGFIFASFQVHIAIHATDIGISSSGAAMVLTVIGFGTIAGQVGLSNIGDRFGTRNAYIVGLGGFVIAIAILLFARQLTYLLVFAAIAGLAFGNSSTQESPLVAWLFGLDSHGTILGVCACCWTLGGAVGPLAFGAIYDTQGSYQFAFWMAGLASIVSIVLASLLKKPAAKKKTVLEAI